MTALHVISQSTLDKIEIASPCSASWAEMRGDERQRHCALCDKNVYNLSGMTRREITELIERTEGVFCGRLYRRADGTVLTADCPVGLLAKTRRAARKMALAALALVVTLSGGLLAFLLPAGSESGRHVMGEPMPMGKIAAPVDVVMGAVEDPMPLMGDVALPDDLAPVQGGIAIPAPVDLAE